MSLRPAAFAIPGDLETLTGGYIYERRLLEGLRVQGRDMAYIRLGGSFPDPTPGDMAEAAEQLTAIAPDRPLILDGLVFGSIDTDVLARVRAPVVAMIHHPLAHESGLDPARRDHLFRTERDNLLHTAHVLVPSPHTAALLASDYGVAPGRITIARPGTDAVPGNGAMPPADPPLILSVGIQHPRKGHDVLMRALAQIADRPWQAVIVGTRYDAAHGAELDGLLAELGLDGRVRLAGRVPGEELARLYGQASIFALATRYEGYGIVFDEAMAHGLPIVTCRTGAVPDTVAPGAGVLVPPDAPEDFAKALEQVLGDAVLRGRMAAASRQAGAALPGWPDTARLAGEVLDRVPLPGTRV
jgi:glycosyltransferase involved in cell wall biosynthesis